MAFKEAELHMLLQLAVRVLRVRKTSRFLGMEIAGRAPRAHDLINRSGPTLGSFSAPDKCSANDLPTLAGLLGI